jgi:hypothetical protein
LAGSAQQLPGKSELRLPLDQLPGTVFKFSVTTGLKQGDKFPGLADTQRPGYSIRQWL